MNNITGFENLIDAYQNSNENDKFSTGRHLYSNLKRLGYISQSIEVLEELIRLYPKQKFLYRELDFNKDLLALLNEYGGKMALVETADSLKPLETSFNKKVVHVLNTSIPYLNNGYSIRSKYIIENQKSYGLEPVVITRPGFPNDFFPSTIDNEENELYQETINDITYYRPLLSTFMRYTPIRQYIEDFSQQIQHVISNNDPAVIQAASNYIIGMSGLNAARRSHKPFVYEIRGFWELTRASKEPLFLNSEGFMLAQAMETYLAYNADRVIVICEHLKKELENRGVNPSKISIVPNGVEWNLFNLDSPDEELKNQYVKDTELVIGYIGSLLKYEGLQLLLKALAKMKARKYDIKAVIVGDGEYKANLEKLSQDLNLDDSVFFTGKVEHTKVAQYYSIFDICVYPRIKDDVTDLVTPLKPLEAMASGKAIICSDVEALKEMIIPYENGLLFDNTLEGLCEQLGFLYRHKRFRDILGEKSKHWVKENRDWQKLMKTYDAVYESLFS